MVTRIISITLVVVFLAGIILTSFWAIWSDRQTAPPAPVEAKETLADFTPLTDRLTELAIDETETGSGRVVTAADNVTINYKAALADNGQVIDFGSTSKTFGLSSAAEIEGLLEGIIGMKVGGQRRLLIPAELGYADLGHQDPETGDTIVGSDRDLVYDVSLVGIASGVPTKFSPRSEPITELEIDDLVVGSGLEATIGDEVTVHYTGALATTGVVFDSSYDEAGSGQPTTFLLAQGSVIDGWVEGVAGMLVGGRRQIMIPSAMGYGESGFGTSIPPDSDLVFEVELIDVKPPEEE